MKKSKDKIIQDLLQELNAVKSFYGRTDVSEAEKQAQKLPITTNKYDKRKDWRKYSWEADVSSNGYTNYWISKKQILNKNDWSSWR